MNKANFTSSFPLNKAPFDQPLTLVTIDNERLAQQLATMGLYCDSTMTRIDETQTAQTIRIQSASGQAILSGGMGTQTIIHLDDDRRLPLLDMEVGESGHIEGITGGYGLAETLTTLGLNENERITLIRKLPPMEYQIRVGDGGRVNLSEGDAARIWGTCNGQTSQFSLASVRNDFRVDKLLGGKKAQQRLRQLGITNKKSLRLESVRSVQPIQLGWENQLAITTSDGLHLHLSKIHGDSIQVCLL